MYKKIVLAYDGSVVGQAALINSKEIASWSGAEIHLITVKPNLDDIVGDGTFIDVNSEYLSHFHIQRQLDAGIQSLKDCGHICCGTLLIGDSVKEITRYARKVVADLIVISHTHNLSNFSKWWASSASSNMVEYAPCNLLVVVSK
jgi:nucleotide-binding universal stress UspA family protein